MARVGVIFLIATLVVAVLRNERPGLHAAIEGVVLDRNFRDIGDSLNSCLQATGVKFNFRNRMLLRSNQWFSGWSCEGIGSPDAIVSLNYYPERGWLYFCGQENGSRLIGQVGSQVSELSDIEYLATWDEPEMRQGICSNLELIIGSVNSGKRTLFHCEAGRDRTGAIAGLLAALVMEENGIPLGGGAIGAIECDYRQSKSLVSEKYGRIESFIQNVLLKYHSVSAFLVAKCDMNPSQLHEFALRLGVKGEFP